MWAFGHRVSYLREIRQAESTGKIRKALKRLKGRV